MFFRNLTAQSTRSCSEKIEQLQNALAQADAVIVGAGAGLSASAGFAYSGERFEKYFWDFRQKYGFRDMYSGGFFPYRTPEEYWAYWSRYIWANRYMDAPKDTYRRLLELVKDKDYFVLTTNVDHCFQKAGFAKRRLFYTQGDYGLWQCSKPCHSGTYDNENAVREMLESQGWEIGEDAALTAPQSGSPAMAVPAALVPRCPVCGEPMTMNLRADERFVEDEGWHEAAERYSAFLRRHARLRVVFLELGVGGNTPAIIKYPFWRMTAQNPQATYVCVNYAQALCPQQIERQSLCLNADIDRTLAAVQAKSPSGNATGH